MPTTKIPAPGASPHVVELVRDIAEAAPDLQLDFAGRGVTVVFRIMLQLNGRRRRWG
jgi:hypothetical protein